MTAFKLGAVLISTFIAVHFCDLKEGEEEV